jgi:hypothetical protein
MPKRSKKSNKESDTSDGGILAAVTQDLELTVEQAEEAAKKAAHAAADALRIMTPGALPVPQPKSKKGSITAKQIAQSRASNRSKRTPKG